MLLYVRTITDAFQTFDVIFRLFKGLFLILLWHPNFKLAQKIIEYVKSLKEKGHIDAAVGEIKKKIA